jgi:hypothetical protein
MTRTTHQEDTVSKNFKKADHDKIIGTSLMGSMDISYAELVEVLGPPHSNWDGEKVDAEWLIEFEDGSVASIYNYKTGKNYGNVDGLETEDIRDWHIGGKHKSVVPLVQNLFPTYQDHHA